MDMSDVPSNAPSGPKRNSTGPVRHQHGRKRAHAISSAMVDSGDVTMGGTSERPARRVRSSIGGQASSSGAQHLKRATTAPSAIRSATKRPSSKRLLGGGPAAGLVQKATRDAQSATSKRPEAVELISTFLASRYNPEHRLLNLEKMLEDPIWKGSNLKRPGMPDSKATLVMWKLVRDKYFDTVSLSLAHNDLANLNDLAPPSLVDALPNLENLSLEGNKIEIIQALNALNQTNLNGRPGLGCLREMVLTGNPLWEKAAAENQLETVVKQVTLRYPTLSNLSGIVVTPTAEPKPVARPSSTSTPLGSGLKKTAQFPAAMKPSHMDDSGDLVGAFLTQYFNLFDSNRKALQPVYAENATFSLSVNSTIPHRSFHTKEVQALPSQHTLKWQPYFEQSRNMVQTNKLSPEQLEQNIQQRIRSGPQNIIEALECLPATEHQVSEREKYVVDAWAQPGLLANNATGLFVNIHGQFYEGTKKAVRSFDRTFLLAPPDPGTPAQVAGWPCVVITDMMVVRGYTHHSVWQDTALPVASPASAQQPPASAPSSLPASATVAPAIPGSTLAPEQQNMVLQLQQQTKLSVDFATQCLTESGWNLATALEMFQNVRASIPPHAFVS